MRYYLTSLHASFSTLKGVEPVLKAMLGSPRFAPIYYNLFKRSARKTTSCLMTSRQTILKKIYPLLMEAGKIFGLKAGVIKNKDNTEPLTSFYNLKAISIDGQEIDFKEFKGMNVLIVNTASGCGYTNQLSDLKKLHELYKNKVVVIGFPANDFKEQEKLTDKEIASFCLINFGVSFLLAQKSVVVKGDNQNEVFAWLSHKEKNGWNDKPPEWNFSKYLINTKGMLTYYFGPGVEPLSTDITAQLG
ncbi:MAG: glutathione peroxidase [Segetibacter sp.]|jgi:glutathione peroxidase|nr:glutathione peroxidase [Segetibacter sp.]